MFKVLKYEKEGNSAFEIRLWKLFYRSFTEKAWEFDKTTALGLHIDPDEICVFGCSKKKMTAFGWMKKDSGHMEKSGWVKMSGGCPVELKG